MSVKISPKSRNCSIDIFRILFAIYVVALHSIPIWLDSHPFLSVTILSFFRFSVPFFLMISGYYFFKKSENYLSNIFIYLKKIIITYFFWSCLYFVISFISWGYKSPVGFLVNCVYSFLVSGSYYHLWYFPALIFAICLSALFYRLGLKKTLFCISFLVYPLCYLLSNYNLLTSAPVVSKGISILQPLAQGLFYFNCGQLINIIHHKYTTTKNQRSLTFILPFCVLLWFALIWCDFFFSLDLDLIIIFGIYFNVGMIILVLLLNPMPKYSDAAQKCRYLANFTYYSHPFFRFLLDYINKNWITFSDSWNFPITIALTITIGLILYHINNKHMNRFIG